MVTVTCLLQDSKKQCALKAGRDLLSPALTHLPSSPRTRIPLFPLLSLAESCSCDHRAVPHSQLALGAATREAKSLHPSTMPGDISFLGALGNLTPDLHTRGLFQNMQESHSVWNGMYPSLHFPCLTRALLSVNCGLPCLPQERPS